MDVLFSPTPLAWLQIAAAMVLMMGPGVALYAFGASGLKFDRTDSIALSLALALAFWPILLAWTSGLGLFLSPAAVFVVCVLGWVAGTFRLVRISKDLWLRFPDAGLEGVPRLALWIVLLATAVIGLLALRGAVAAPGSDGYHHTLFAQSIAVN